LSWSTYEPNLWCLALSILEIGEDPKFSVSHDPDHVRTTGSSESFVC